VRQESLPAEATDEEIKRGLVVVFAVQEAERYAEKRELVEREGGTLLRMRVGSLDWMAGVLARLGCQFTVIEPTELP
jgi:predicted DNA-binding transcriptional regulator YafY